MGEAELPSGALAGGTARSTVRAATPKVDVQPVARVELQPATARVEALPVTVLTSSEPASGKSRVTWANRPWSSQRLFEKFLVQHRQEMDTYLAQQRQEFEEWLSRQPRT
jgi:hypothetical protein